MEGYKKIECTCRQAEKDGLAYAWVDTCCIDKDSGAELSESINSMFRWYQNSFICYVYLYDAELGSRLVPGKTPGWSNNSNTLAKALRSCRWLKRGWTLQEMLAPGSLAFFDRGWRLCGTLNRHEPYSIMATVLCELTGVDSELLENKTRLDEYSFAHRISWASGRATTRVEDTAYSLLGLLGVNLPLLYGEGTKAFLRLQEEVLRSTTDRSDLLWTPHSIEHMHMLFAPDVSCFAEDLISWKTLRSVTDSDNILTNRGLRTTLYCSQLASSDYIMASPCPVRYDSIFHDAMILRRVMSPGDQNTTSTVKIPAFEVIRAVAPRVRQEELTQIGESWTQQELVILRASHGPTYYLDLSCCLEVEDLYDYPVKPRRSAEIRSARPIQSLRVSDLETNTTYLLRLQLHDPTHDMSAQWITWDYHPTGSDCSPVGREREVLRAVHGQGSPKSMSSPTGNQYPAHLAFQPRPSPSRYSHPESTFPALFGVAVEIGQGLSQTWTGKREHSAATRRAADR